MRIINDMEIFIRHTNVQGRLVNQTPVELKEGDLDIFDFYARLWCTTLKPKIDFCESDIRLLAEIMRRYRNAPFSITGEIREKAREICGLKNISAFNNSTAKFLKAEILVKPDPEKRSYKFNECFYIYENGGYFNFSLSGKI